MRSNRYCRRGDCRPALQGRDSAPRCRERVRDRLAFGNVDFGQSLYLSDVYGSSKRCLVWRL